MRKCSGLIILFLSWCCGSTMLNPAWASPASFSWPSEIDKARLAHNHGIPVSFWDLPLAAQIAAPALEAFYRQKYSPQGAITPTNPQILVRPNDRLLMAQYITGRLHDLFTNPAAPLYQQALVQVDEQTKRDTKYPIITFKNNPELDISQRGPLAKFLASVAQQYGDQVQLMIDPLDIFQQGYRAAFFPAKRGPLAPANSRYLGHINLGLAIITHFLNPRPFSLADDPTIVHEFFHVQAAQLQNAGKVKFYLGQITAADEAAENHYYRGDFNLEEIPAHLYSVDRLLAELSWAPPTNRPAVAPAKVKFWQKWWHKLQGARPKNEDLPPAAQRLTAQLSCLLDFLELGLTITTQTLQNLQQQVPDPATHPWDMYHRPYSQINFDAPYMPFAGGILFQVQVPNNFKYALSDSRQSPASFTLILPFNVLREVYAAKEEAPLTKYQLYDPKALYAALKKDPSKIPPYDEQKFLEVSQRIYNPLALEDIRQHLQQQQAAWQKIAQIIVPIAQQWTQIAQGKSPRTPEVLQQLRTNLQPLFALIEDKNPCGPHFSK